MLYDLWGGLYRPSLLFLLHTVCKIQQTSALFKSALCAVVVMTFRLTFLLLFYSVPCFSLSFQRKVPYAIQNTRLNVGRHLCNLTFATGVPPFLFSLNRHLRKYLENRNVWFSETLGHGSLNSVSFYCCLLTGNFLPELISLFCYFVKIARSKQLLLTF